VHVHHYERTVQKQYFIFIALISLSTLNMFSLQKYTNVQPLCQLYLCSFPTVNAHSVLLGNFPISIEEYSRTFRRSHLPLFSGFNPLFFNICLSRQTSKGRRKFICNIGNYLPIDMHSYTIRHKSLLSLL
jgi:hypothetical protein